jgi:tRNA-2-methylthio-N6-dimethylallyladenosine synthase
MKNTVKTIDEKIQGKALVTEKRIENSKKLFIESYGCQMNMNDSEIVGFYSR